MESLSNWLLATGAAWLEATWAIVVESGWWLVLGFLAAGLVHAFLPTSWIQRHLGGRGLFSNIKAAIVGAPLPLCSCSVIPTAAAVRRSGASKGATASFAIATPETGVDSVGITFGLMGPWVAIARPISAIATAIATGSLVDMFVKDDAKAQPDATPAQASSCCASKKSAPAAQVEPAAAPCCASTVQVSTPSGPSCCDSAAPAGGAGDDAPRSLGRRTLAAIRYGWLDMPADLSLWLILGFAISGLIGVLVPTAWLESINGPAALGIALVAGLPVYVCAVSSTPIAAALVAGGLSPGAGLVFLLAGPATNTATMLWVLKDLGVRALVIYAATISVFAVGAGALFDLLVPAGVVRGAITHAHEHGGPLTLLGGVAVATLLLAGATVKLKGRFAKVETAPHAHGDAGKPAPACCH